VDSRIEAEVKAQVEREQQRAEYKQRRRQAEQEEKAREQITVTFRDNEKGYQWDEVHSVMSLQQNAYRDPETRRLRTYSNKKGQLDKTFDILHLQPAPPAARRKKNEEG
jgi:hypothetical protein